MKTLTSHDWAARFLADAPPRAKSLVMTVFGDAIAPHGGAVWLGSLIELMAPFGVNDRLVRTSVFRLAQEGWLGATRDGRRAAYALLPGALPHLERANRRIYAPLVLHWDGRWTMVQAAHLDPARRSQLRKELEWLGFGQLAPHLFGHAAAEPALLAATLARLQLGDQVFVWSAAAQDGMAARPLAELVASGWDLRAVTAGYAEFLERFAPLPALLAAEGRPDPAHAYLLRSLLIHAYRRVQLHDPYLPVELLPDPWPGAQAYALARTLYRQLAQPAQAHVLAAMRREDPDTPEADAAFHKRFE
ncbi:PaaX family transcriptional regulator C-terminal domain-containing protein [Massilia sp. TS11]|uniref:PaaX family transcriptional regulator n=1 Tax=Massilia sp. TS11 TaxID=2908003 RepID=UPI001EDB26C6|nr:PaaX family transcriptional regulator C-terminal domain-containing protein [Massilia sp. TS11]MCG2586252.1 phenylacetic acid degradation operon negative regulatory protein PaaX [Massilia sp. TS11]